MRSSGASACGAIARNAQGLIHFSMGCKLEQCSSVEEAEGLSLMHGLRELAKICNGPIQVEVDCSSLASALSPGSTNRSSLFPIIAELRSILAGFRAVDIGWISRSGNKAAHFLAARVRTHGDFLHIGYAPNELQEILSNDCNPAA